MREWFYAENSQRQGPVSDEQIVSLFTSGQLSVDTMVWTHGFPNWMRAAEVPGLIPAQSVPPPVPMVAAVRAPGREGAMYLHISVTRLAVMSILSMGVYDAYWIYKNWKYIKKRDGLDIWPFWRGLFGILFIYPLLKAISEDKELTSIQPSNFKASTLATGWILLWLASSGLGRSDNEWVNLAGILIGIPAFAFLIPVQQYINRINASLNPPPRRYIWYSTGHILCALFGVFIWILVLAAYLLPDPEAGAVDGGTDVVTEEVAE